MHLASICLTLLLTPAQTSIEDDLKVLEAKAAVIAAETNWIKRTQESKKLDDSLLLWIQSDRLATGAHFLRAARLVGSGALWFETARLRHEWAIVAAALGEKEAFSMLGSTWDGVMVTLGRPTRFGHFAAPPGVSSGVKAEPAPKSVFAVVKEPSKAIAAVTGVKDNEELQRIRSEDQKVRQQDWSKLTAADFERISKGDAARKNRILQMLDEGLARTGRDFEAAALVMQHGSGFEDYRLAHELSLAAVIAGYPEAIWLVSRSYDRMLMSIGHRQRFVTQFDGLGLRPYDLTGMSDRIFKAVKSTTLREAIEQGRKIAEGGGF